MKRRRRPEEMLLEHEAACHEAGHALLGLHFGVQVPSIDIQHRADGSAGFAAMAEHPDRRKEGMIKLAGDAALCASWCNRLTFAQAARGFPFSGGATDFPRARRFLRPGEREAAWQEVVTFFQENRRAHSSLTLALYRRRRLSGAQVLRVLRRAGWGGGSAPLSSGVVGRPVRVQSASHGKSHCQGRGKS